MLYINNFDLYNPAYNVSGITFFFSNGKINNFKRNISVHGRDLVLGLRNANVLDQPIDYLSAVAMEEGRQGLGHFPFVCFHRRECRRAFGLEPPPDYYGHPKVVFNTFIYELIID